MKLILIVAVVSVFRGTFGAPKSDICSGATESCTAVSDTKCCNTICTSTNISVDGSSGICMYGTGNTLQLHAAELAGGSTLRMNGAAIKPQYSDSCPIDLSMSAGSQLLLESGVDVWSVAGCPSSQHSLLLKLDRSRVLLSGASMWLLSGDTDLTNTTMIVRDSIQSYDLIAKDSRIATAADSIAELHFNGAVSLVEANIDAKWGEIHVTNLSMNQSGILVDSNGNLYTKHLTLAKSSINVANGTINTYSGRNHGNVTLKQSNISIVNGSMQPNYAVSNGNLTLEHSSFTVVNGNINGPTTNVHLRQSTISAKNGATIWPSSRSGLTDALTIADSHLNFESPGSSISFCKGDISGGSNITLGEQARVDLCGCKLSAASSLNAGAKSKVYLDIDMDNAQVDIGCNATINYNGSNAGITVMNGGKLTVGNNCNLQMSDSSQSNIKVTTGSSLALEDGASLTVDHYAYCTVTGEVCIAEGTSQEWYLGLSADGVDCGFSAGRSEAALATIFGRKLGFLLGNRV